MIHSTLEESLECTCPNCGKDHHAKFFSLFVSDMHYIIGDCEMCGYRIEFRKDELGSGLFLPNGDVTTVKDTFKKTSVEHAKAALEVKDDSTKGTFAGMRLRFLDKEEIREERERH